MEKEIWKDIPGFEGEYQASNFKRIRSLNYNREKKTKVLKTKIGKRGYEVITLKDKKTRYVHRLVASAFLGEEIPANLHVDHINSDKTFNALDNLEVVTPRENSHRHFKKTGRDLPIGVHFSKRHRAKPYYGMIFYDGKNHNLGYYATPEEASAAYQNALSKYEI